MKALTKIGHLSFFILILSSCGRDYDSKTLEGVRVGESMEIKERTLNPFERDIALRICESYRAKWVEFRLNKLDENFNYTYTAKLCDATTNELNPLETKLVQSTTEEDSALMFKTTSFVNYVQDMQTHMHGDLNEICGPLMTRGETPRISFEGEDEIIQFEFKENGEQDVYSIYRIERQQTEEGSRNIVVGQDTFQVLTKPEAAHSSLKGLVTNSQRVRPCSSGSPARQATFTQEYNY